MSKQEKKGAKEAKKEAGKSGAATEKWEPKPGTYSKLSVLASSYKRKHESFVTQEKSLTERRQRQEEQVTKLQKSVEDLGIKIQTLEAPSFFDSVAEPIAKELEKMFPGTESQTLAVGTAIVIGLRKGEEGKSVTLVPMEKGALGVRDYEKTTSKRFPKGSLEEIQGLNHPTVPIPEEADVRWLAQWLR